MDKAWIKLKAICYLHQGGYVFAGVYLPACLLDFYQKKPSKRYKFYFN